MVYLGLGTNLGNRAANLNRAVELIHQAGISVLQRSSLYETEPRDVTDQPWFLNMVLACETQLSAADLMQKLLELEIKMGRDRSGQAVPRGPRLIDIDLLLYGQSVIDTPQLTIPHPRLTERRFVLEPLLELAPGLCDPRTGLSLAEALAAVRGQITTKLT